MAVGDSGAAPRFFGQRVQRREDSRFLRGSAIVEVDPETGFVRRLIVVEDCGDVPSIEVHHLETPSPFTLHGLKGMGEGGAIGPGAAIAAAVEDAIRPLTPAHVDRLPLTPERVLGWIRAGQSSPAALARPASSRISTWP
jgi:hypothetical protein